MKTFLKLSAWSLFAMLLACLVGAALVMGFAHEGLAHSGNWQVVVDGDTVANAQMLRDSWEHDEWNGIEAFLGIALSFFILLLTVPLLLLLGVGLPLLVVLLGLGAVAASLLGAAALLSAPLLLPILLIVWLARRKPKVAA
jgi:hypothetical protein